MTRIFRFTALGVVALVAAVGGRASGAHDAATVCRAWHPHAAAVGGEHGLHPDPPAVSDTRDPWTPHVPGAELLHDPWSPAAPASAQHHWSPAVPAADPQHDVWHPARSGDCAGPGPHAAAAHTTEPHHTPAHHSPAHNTPAHHSHSHHEEQP